jgi:MoxR-like ATPase
MNTRELSIVHIDPEALSQMNMVDRFVLGGSQCIVGYRDVMTKIAYAIIADMHPLLESVPGLSKTLMIKAFAKLVDGAETNRTQMTSDLMPADITGYNRWDQKSGEMVLVKGPIFTNFYLADEVNRTTPKTQSALLQAMQEREVTIGGVTHRLPDPFIAFATMNPIEQEGTYDLPEAQLDRFGARINFSYLDRANELVLAANHRLLRMIDPTAGIKPVMTLDDIRATREHVLNNIYTAPAATEYMVDLIRATRPGYDGFGGNMSDNDKRLLAEELEFGCSPRAVFGFAGIAQARAYHLGRDYVIPEDIKFIAAEVLAHRMGLKPAAQAQGKSTIAIVNQLLQHVPIIDSNDATFKPKS